MFITLHFSPGCNMKNLSRKRNELESFYKIIRSICNDASYRKNVLTTCFVTLYRYLLLFFFFTYAQFKWVVLELW